MRAEIAAHPDGRPLASEGGEARARQVVWQDSLRTAEIAAARHGREYLEGVLEGRFPLPPYAELIGIRLVAVGDGSARFEVVADESTNNIAGLAHGGMICSLLDFACGLAVQTLAPPGVTITTVQMNVNFVRPIAVGELVEVEGETVRQGRRIGFAEARATRGGELAASASATMTVQRISA